MSEEGIDDCSEHTVLMIAIREPSNPELCNQYR